MLTVTPAFAAQEGMELKDNVSPEWIWVTANYEEEGDVTWILPGPRELDPDVFGTPDQPLGTEAPPLGVPVMGRMTNEDGTAFTTTAVPTPFSDNYAPIQGSLNFTVKDITLVDGQGSKDEVSFYSEFTGPNGKHYEIIVDMVIPMGDDHPFFGGVATDVIHHGSTGIGSRLVPTAYTYVTFWGVGILRIDGEVVADNRVVHVMVTGNMRDENYEMVLTPDEINYDEVLIHVVLANIAVSPTGPVMSPVPSGFTLPNDMEQPFIHVNYHNVQMTDLNAVKQANTEARLNLAEGTVSSLESELVATNNEKSSIEDQFSEAEDTISSLETDLEDASSEIATLSDGQGFATSTVILVAIVVSILGAALSYFVTKKQ